MAHPSDLPNIPMPYITHLICSIIFGMCHVFLYYLPVKPLLLGKPINPVILSTHVDLFTQWIPGSQVSKVHLLCLRYLLHLLHLLHLFYQNDL